MRGAATPAAAPPGVHRAADGERAVELRIGRLLQVGVALSAAVVVLGAAALLAHAGARPVAFAHFAPDTPALRSVGGIVRAAAALDPRAVVQLGLVLLVATPIARVAFTLVAFALQRDRLYVALTAVVLLLLAFSLAGRAV